MLKSSRILKTILPIEIRKLARWLIEYPEIMGQATRHANAFSTHIPVLTALAHILQIRSVLELGSGIISTLHFLNRDAFPLIASIVSYENDYEWYQIVRSRTSDARLELHFVPDDMHTLVASLDLTKFDLIFVDDSKFSEQRSQTIRQLALRKDDVTGLVAIHDFEQRDYRNAALPFPHCKRFRAFNPEVGIVWSRHNLRPQVFQHIDRVIRANAQRVYPDDVNGWIKVLEGQS